MNKKQAVAAALITALLISSAASFEFIKLTSANYVPWVWHNSGIYIQSDGTVLPADAPIQRLGNEYAFKSDIFAGIAVQRSNAVINGNGHKLLGNYYGTGLLLQNVSNVIIQNIGVQYFGQGIYLDNANNSILRGNTLEGCGVETFQSSNNQVTANKIGGDISLDFSNNNKISQNNASSISISWSANITVANNRFADPKRTNTQLTSANYTEGIYIDNSLNCMVISNSVERKNVGVDIWESANTTFTNNQLSDNQVGFKLWGSDLKHNIQSIDVSNTVNGKPVYFLVEIANYQVPSNAGWIVAINCKNITVKNWISTPNWDGVLFVGTQNSEILNSVLSDNYNAIRFYNVSNTTITKSTMNNNQHAAFYFEATANCLITENEVSNNFFLFDLRGYSTRNHLYQNDFIGNQTGVFENGSANFWDNGTEGNYWSSFTGVDLNLNGISDTPFLLDPHLNETDNYPLMSPIKNQTANVQDPQNSGPILAMPEEYLNYTISDINGAIWAKVDGVYPMHLSNYYDGGLPMLYPTPPNTTNIHVLLNGLELSWSNYIDVNSNAIHHTDIGDWQMISCLLNPISTDFVLEIHYEHPVQVVNGSYTFLYDLNISPYLSPSSARSTAHFRIQLIQLPANASTLTVFTTGSDKGWSHVDFSSNLNATTEIATFNIVSEYNRTLPGDVAMVLDSFPVPEFSTWIIFPLICIITSGIVVYNKRSRRHFRHGKC